MDNNQTANDDDDLSSTTGSDFEPVDVPHQEQEPLNDGNVQPTLAVSQPQHMTAMNVAALNARVHWLEKQLLMEKLKVSEEKLKVAEANKEKVEAEKVGLKVRLEMMEQKQEGDDQMGKKISELVGTKLTENFQNMKENIMEVTRKLIQAEFSTFKQGIEKRLVNVEKRFEKLDQLGVAKHALNKQLLKQRLTTGGGLLRNVSLVRIASNELITFGGWSIQDGRLKAKKIGARTRGCVRAEKPFPVAGACPNVFYFEVTVITARCNSCMYIGLCDANFHKLASFTTGTSVGRHTGSFAINKCGEYWASGTFANHGKGYFANGDVVGCGLLILSTERRLFFTKNDKIWGKPILLGPKDAKSKLFPTVSSDEADDEVEFNFSGPFRYPLAHLNVVM